MRKTLLTILVTLLLLTSACALKNSDKAESKKTYTVTFVNYDDSVISSTVYAEGEKLVMIQDPEQIDFETQVYIFQGWDKEIEEVVTHDATYKAEYMVKDIYIPDAN